MHSVAEVCHTIRRQWLSASKGNHFLKTGMISFRTIVESLVMKNPVPIPVEMGTTDRTCSVSLFLQLIRVAYPNWSITNYCIPVSNTLLIHKEGKSVPVCGSACAVGHLVSEHTQLWWCSVDCVHHESTHMHYHTKAQHTSLTLVLIGNKG